MRGIVVNDVRARGNGRGSTVLAIDIVQSVRAGRHSSSSEVAPECWKDPGQSLYMPCFQCADENGDKIDPMSSSMRDWAAYVRDIRHGVPVWLGATFMRTQRSLKSSLVHLRMECWTTAPLAMKHSASLGWGCPAFHTVAKCG